MQSSASQWPCTPRRQESRCTPRGLLLHHARDVRCLIRRRPGMLHVAGLFLAFPPRLELLALRVVQASDPHRSRRGNRRMDVEDDVAHAAHAPRRLFRPPIELVDRSFVRPGRAARALEEENSVSGGLTPGQL